MKNKNYFSLLVLVIALLGSCWLVPNAIAKIIHTEEGVIITHYPDTFDKIGILDSIDKNGVVIDDMFLPFSEDARFMLPRREYAAIRHFKKGQKVGLLIGEDQKVALLCLFYNQPGHRSR